MNKELEKAVIPEVITTEMTIPDFKDFIPRVVGGNMVLLNKMQTLVDKGVNSDEDRALMLAHIDDADEREKIIKIKVDKYLKPVRIAWKIMNGVDSLVRKPLVEGKEEAEAAVHSYNKEKERKLKAEQERRRIAQEKKEKMDAKHSEAIAMENQRLQDVYEAEKKARQDKIDADAKAEQDKAEIATLEHAEAAEDAGAGTERVSQILENSAPVVVAPEPAPIEKPALMDDAPAVAPEPMPVALIPETAADSGMKESKRWAARQLSFKGILQGVIDGTISEKAVKVHDPFFNSWATGEKKVSSIIVRGEVVVESYQKSKGRRA